MQTLYEKSNGALSVKVFDDGDGGYLAEYYVTGELFRTTPYDPGTPLAEVQRDAEEWIQSIVLNG